MGLNKEEQEQVRQTLATIEVAMQSENPAVKNALKDLIITTVLAEGKPSVSKSVFANMENRLKRTERDLHSIVEKMYNDEAQSYSGRGRSYQHRASEDWFRHMGIATPPTLSTREYPSAYARARNPQGLWSSEIFDLNALVKGDGDK